MSWAWLAGAWLACAPPPPATPALPRSAEGSPASAPATPDPFREVPPAPAGRYAAREIRIEAPAEPGQARDDARARAVAAWKRALAGEDFGDLARALSDAPSAPRGGLLGTFASSTLPAPFEAAVASVPVGQVGPLVELPGSFHVVRREPLHEVRVVWVRLSPSASDEARAAALASLAEGALPSSVAADARSPDDGVLLGPMQWPASLQEAAWKLTEGHAASVDTPSGALVMRRLP